MRQARDRAFRFHDGLGPLTAARPTAWRAWGDVLRSAAETAFVLAGLALLVYVALSE